MDKKKDSFYAKLSFIISLGFWIPLLNIPLSILAIAFGITALRLIHTDPERYSGRMYAIIGIILGSMAIVLFLSIFLFPNLRNQLLQELLISINSTTPG